MSEELNRRFELRAYEDTNACRLASILQELTDANRPTVTREQVAARWAERYPRHAALTGKHRIRNRLSKALIALRAAGIVQMNDDTITVDNRELLAMSVANLQIVEDAEGVAINPARWSRRPSVPSHLLAIQEPFEERRQADAGATEA